MFLSNWRLRRPETLRQSRGLRGSLGAGHHRFLATPTDGLVPARQQWPVPCLVRVSRWSWSRNPLDESGVGQWQHAPGTASPGKCPATFGGAAGAIQGQSETRFNTSFPAGFSRVGSSQSGARFSLEPLNAMSRGVVARNGGGSAGNPPPPSTWPSAAFRSRSGVDGREVARRDYRRDRTKPRFAPGPAGQGRDGRARHQGRRACRDLTSSGSRRNTPPGSGSLPDPPDALGETGAVGGETLPDHADGAAVVQHDCRRPGAGPGTTGRRRFPSRAAMEDVSR